MSVTPIRFSGANGGYPSHESLMLSDIATYSTATGTGPKSSYVSTEKMQKECAGVVFDDSDEVVKGVLYQKGDVLVSNIRPYLQKAWLADRDGVCSTDVLCIRPNEGVDSGYLYSLIGRDSFFVYMMQAAKGSKMPRGDKEFTMALPVSYPTSPEEQQKIASLFTELDNLISAASDEVSALEEAKKGMMQKIFSQEVRFKKDDGTEYTEWEPIRMDIATEVNPKTDTVPDEFYYMDLGGVDHGMWNDRSIVQKEKAPSRAQRVASVGDVFFQSVRPYNMGHFHYTENMDKPVVASTGFIQMKANNGYDAGFIYQLLYEDRFNYYVNRACTGSSYPAINGENFAELEADMPTDIEEQQKVADFLSSMDDAISAAKDELAGYRELKKGLLQKMFA